MASTEATVTPDTKSPAVWNDNEKVGFVKTSALEKDWTPEEERRAKRKLDLIVMPLLMLGFFSLQLDRGNIGNALTDFFLRDVGITQNQFNVGQQLLSAGIVLLEIPSNMILYKIGAQKWLSIQVMAFGLVSIFQAFQHGLAPFLITRLILGLTESGYIPGSIYTLTTWYTREETAKRCTVFFFGNLSAAASTSLMSYGILHMRGVAGRPGWFWLFVLMGIFTCLVSLLLACLLPDSASKPTPWLLPKIRYFTDRELYIIKNRVLIDDPSKGHKKASISGWELKNALKHWALYPHLLICVTNAVSLSAFGSYVPIIIAGFGFGRLRSNALASVGQWIVIPVAFGFAWFSDHFNRRYLTILVSTSLTVIFISLNLGLSVNTAAPLIKRNAKYAAIVLTQSFNFPTHSLNITWLALHCRNNSERAVWMALVIMAANTSGIIGAQIFRQDDRPRYVRGWGCLVGFISLAWITAAAQALHYRLRKKEQVTKAEEDDLKLEKIVSLP